MPPTVQGPPVVVSVTAVWPVLTVETFALSVETPAGASLASAYT